MRIPALTITFALALAIAACGGDGASDTAGNGATEANLADDAALNAALGANDTTPATGAPAALPTDAAGFANAVAASDLYEIESARLALAKSPSADVKSIAQMLEREHGKSTVDLKAAAGDIAVTPALDAEKQGMIDALKGLSGAEFERSFLSQQRTAHQMNLLMLQSYAQAGDNEALKGFAAKAQRVVEGHIDALNQIAK